MFFANKTELLKQSEYGRIYVFKFTLDDGTVVHKVGMCNSDRSTERFMEVCYAFFTVYRYIPRCEIRRDKEVQIPKIVEKHLHELLEDLSYKFDKSFGGSTEFFIGLDEQLFLDYLDTFSYSFLLRGKVSMKETDFIAINKAIESEKPPEDPLDSIIPF